MAYGRIFNRAKYRLLRGEEHLHSDTYKALLVGTGYAFDADQDYVADVAAQELSGTGYVRKTLGSLTVTLDDTNDRAVWGAASVTWTGINAGTILGVVVYRHVTSDADSPLVAYYENGPIVTDGNDEAFNIDSTEGLVQFL